MDPKDDSVPSEHHVHRTGGWLSQDARHHRDWLHKTIEHVEANPKALHPVLQEFKDMIDRDARLYMLFREAYDQVPKQKSYLQDPSGNMKNVLDIDHALRLMNHILETAPTWTDSGHSVGVVGVPMNALLDWPMATSAGFAAFQDPKVNEILKKVLDTWGKFLMSPESAKVLHTGKEGWFGPTGKASLAAVGNAGLTDLTFEELYVCDPNKPHHGFDSWDAWFTRTYRDGVRPIASPDDENIIANACESMPYKVSTDVKARDKFWIKGQPYSVKDMLANDPWADQFVGGTIYQAFLSALSYHRWHSPVTGVIKKTFIIPGTYFSEPIFVDFGMGGNADDQKKGENVCQEYLSVMATRAVIFIEADNKEIGLCCFMGIGMTEVSTCEITVKEGQKVGKGEQLGSFHFGGSTWCGLFRKGVKLEGFPQAGGRKHNVPVRSQLARVVVS